MTTEPLLIQALKGHITDRVPFWFMRQAGRYLPEYKQVRATCNGFLDLCYTPQKAAEVTLQPLRRFGMDGAILFSDILVVADALGAHVTFVEGEGPRIAHCNTAQTIAALNPANVHAHVLPVMETVRLVKKGLPEGAALIGFAGAPWTVACYMIQGRSGKEFEAARLFAIRQPALMQQLIETLTTATIEYLQMQINAGAHAVQIFDSWAGLLTPAEFAKWVIPPTQKIVAALHKSHPNTPIIGFAKGAGPLLNAYAKETNVQCIGVDQHTPMEFAIAQRAHEHQAVQGNLDPLVIASSKDESLRFSEMILRSIETIPAVFNLGHGFIPETPIENVEAVAKKVKAWRR